MKKLKNNFMSILSNYKPIKLFVIIILIIPILFLQDLAVKKNYISKPDNFSILTRITGDFHIAQLPDNSPVMNLSRLVKSIDNKNYYLRYLKNSSLIRLKQIIYTSYNANLNQNNLKFFTTARMTACT